MIREKDKDRLCAAAHAAYANAYIPYSHFPVGAAVLLEDGSIVQGCNIENASYSLCMCAERTAMFSAVAQGYSIEKFMALAIAAPTETLTTPCGSCRQVMAELMGPEKLVLLDNGKMRKEYTVEELLPDSFVL